MLKTKKLLEEQKSGNTTLNLLVYGAPKIGKTSFAATAAKLGKVCYLDLEQGTKFIDKELAKNIDILELSTIDELKEIIKSGDLKQYKTLVIDSITELMKQWREKVKGAKVVENISDWNVIILEMDKLFRELRDLDINVILISLEKEFENEGKLEKRPAIASKDMPNNVCGMQDCVLYLTADNNHKRYLFTKPTDKFYAGCRELKGKELPDKLEGEQIDFAWIYNQMLEEPVEVTVSQLKEMEDLVRKLQMDEETLKKMNEFAGIKEGQKIMAYQLAKLIPVLNQKLELQNRNNEGVK